MAEPTGMLTRSRSRTSVNVRASKVARLSKTSETSNSPLIRSKSRSALETTRVLYDALPTSDASSSSESKDSKSSTTVISDGNVEVASEIATKAQVAYISGALRRPIIIWDTETTGLSPKTHDMVEIALEELGSDNGRTMLSFSSLVRPPNLPEPRARNRVHGITNAMMQDSPSFEQVWPAIEEYVSDVQARYGGTGGNARPILVAHNMGFDLRFLRMELERIGRPLPKWDFACSLHDVAKRLWPNRKLSLAALTELADVVNEDAHRALADVQATSGVLHYVDRWLSKHADQNVDDETLPIGVRIRTMILEGAQKRRKLIHGDDADDMDMEDAMSITSTTVGAGAGANAAALSKSISMLTEPITAVEEDEIMEESENEMQSDSDSDDEEEELRYHWVENGTTYHNMRDCSMLGRSLRTETTIFSEARPPADRKLCLRCRSSISVGTSDTSPSKMSITEVTPTKMSTSSNEANSSKYSIITRSRSSTSLRAQKLALDEDDDEVSDIDSDSDSDNDVTMKLFSSSTETGSNRCKPVKQQSWYVAPTGTLYHSNRACVNLELARVIRRVDDIPMGRYPCNRCVKGGRTRIRPNTRA